MNMNEAIQVFCIIHKLPPSWKDFKHTLKHLKEELTLVELGSHLRIEESPRMQDSDKPKGNNVAGPLVVNIVEHNNSSRYNENKGKRKYDDNTRDDPNKKSKVTCWKCGKPGHLKKIAKDDDVAWWADSRETVHVCKDRCWFKTYESLNDGSILHMGNKSTALVHGRGCVDLKLSSGQIDKALNKFKVFKTKVELQRGSQIKRFRTDKGGEYMDTLYFQSIDVISETTVPYTSQQNGISERNNRVLKEMVNFILSYSEPSQGFWGEAMLTTCYLLYRVPNKRNMITPYELWTKRKPNLNYLRVWGCRAVVRLLDPKLKTISERGIECIFVGYVEHSKAFRFYVIEPNDSVLINSIIKLRDVIFDVNRFSSVPRPSQRSLVNKTKDIGCSVVPEEVIHQPEPELRKSKRNRTPKDFRPEFQIYLIEGTRDKVSDQHSHCFNVEDEPKTFDEAMKSHDVAFWKEAINDDMDFIIGNNT
nr:zinc finger, CCHC-type [Tanacetum cinerariifolium]